MGRLGIYLENFLVDWMFRMRERARFSTKGNIAHPPSTRACLATSGEIFGVITTGEGLLQASSGQKPGVLLNIPQGTGHPTANIHSAKEQRCLVCGKTRRKGLWGRGNEPEVSCVVV